MPRFNYTLELLGCALDTKTDQEPENYIAIKSSTGLLSNYAVHIPRQIAAESSSSTNNTNRALNERRALAFAQDSTFGKRFAAYSHRERTVAIDERFSQNIETYLALVYGPRRLSPEKLSYWLLRRPTKTFGRANFCFYMAASAHETELALFNNNKIAWSPGEFHRYELLCDVHLPSPGDYTIGPINETIRWVRPGVFEPINDVVRSSDQGAHGTSRRERKGRQRSTGMSSTVTGVASRRTSGRTSAKPKLSGQRLLEATEQFHFVVDVAEFATTSEKKLVKLASESSPFLNLEWIQKMENILRKRLQPPENIRRSSDRDKTACEQRLRSRVFAEHRDYLECVDETLWFVTPVNFNNLNAQNHQNDLIINLLTRVCYVRRRLTGWTPSADLPTTQRDEQFFLRLLFTQISMTDPDVAYTQMHSLLFNQYYMGYAYRARTVLNSGLVSETARMMCAANWLARETLLHRTGESRPQADHEASAALRFRFLSGYHLREYASKRDMTAPTGFAIIQGSAQYCDPYTRVRVYLADETPSQGDDITAGEPTTLVDHWKARLFWQTRCGRQSSYGTTAEDNDDTNNDDSSAVQIHSFLEQVCGDILRQIAVEHVGTNRNTVSLAVFYRDPLHDEHTELAKQQQQSDHDESGQHEEEEEPVENPSIVVDSSSNDEDDGYVYDNVQVQHERTGGLRSQEIENLLENASFSPTNYFDDNSSPSPKRVSTPPHSSSSQLLSQLPENSHRDEFELMDDSWQLLNSTHRENFQQLSASDRLYLQQRHTHENLLSEANSALLFASSQTPPLPSSPSNYYRSPPLGIVPFSLTPPSPMTSLRVENTMDPTSLFDFVPHILSPEDEQRQQPLFPILSPHSPVESNNDRTLLNLPTYEDHIHIRLSLPAITVSPDPTLILAPLPENRFLCTELDIDSDSLPPSVSSPSAPTATILASPQAHEHETIGPDTLRYTDAHLNVDTLVVRFGPITMRVTDANDSMRKFMLLSSQSREQPPSTIVEEEQVMASSSTSSQHCVSPVTVSSALSDTYRWLSDMNLFRQASVVGRETFNSIGELMNTFRVEPLLLTDEGKTEFYSIFLHEMLQLPMNNEIGLQDLLLMSWLNSLEIERFKNYNVRSLHKDVSTSSSSSSSSAFVTNSSSTDLISTASDVALLSVQAMNRHTIVRDFGILSIDLPSKSRAKQGQFYLRPTLKAYQRNINAAVCRSWPSSNFSNTIALHTVPHSIVPTLVGCPPFQCTHLLPNGGDWKEGAWHCIRSEWEKTRNVLSQLSTTGTLISNRVRIPLLGQAAAAASTSEAPSPTSSAQSDLLDAEEITYRALSDMLLDERGHTLYELYEVPIVSRPQLIEQNVIRDISLTHRWPLTAAHIYWSRKTAQNTDTSISQLANKASTSPLHRSSQSNTSSTSERASNTVSSAQQCREQLQILRDKFQLQNRSSRQKKFTLISLRSPLKALTREVHDRLKQFLRTPTSRTGDNGLAHPNQLQSLCAALTFSSVADEYAHEGLCPHPEEFYSPCPGYVVEDSLLRGSRESLATTLVMKMDIANITSSEQQSKIRQKTSTTKTTAHTTEKSSARSRSLHPRLNLTANELATVYNRIPTFCIRSLCSVLDIVVAMDTSRTGPRPLHERVHDSVYQQSSALRCGIAGVPGNPCQAHIGGSGTQLCYLYLEPDPAPRFEHISVASNTSTASAVTSIKLGVLGAQVTTVQCKATARLTAALDEVEHDLIPILPFVWISYARARSVHTIASVYASSKQRMDTAMRISKSIDEDNAKSNSSESVASAGSDSSTALHYEVSVETIQTTQDQEDVVEWYVYDARRWSTTVRYVRYTSDKSSAQCTWSQLHSTHPNPSYATAFITTSTSTSAAPSLWNGLNSDEYEHLRTIPYWQLIIESQYNSDTHPHGYRELLVYYKEEYKELREALVDSFNGIESQFQIEFLTPTTETACRFVPQQILQDHSKVASNSEHSSQSSLDTSSYTTSESDYDEEEDNSSPSQWSTDEDDSESDLDETESSEEEEEE